MFTHFFRRTAKNMVEVTFKVIARPSVKHSPVLIDLREKLHPGSLNQIALTLEDAYTLRNELCEVLTKYEEIHGL